jgi:diadenosine tetraphosphatase ApaH/serine/threonine PP2A family protein phosphatase
LSYPLTAIISDLHSNVPALETALRDAFARGVRRFVCLGDVIGYGAEPRKCLDWVMELASSEPTIPEDLRDAYSGDLEPGLCLMGNHEHALMNTPEDFNPKARAAIDWTREELGNGGRERGFAYWDFLGELEASADDACAQFAHGSPRDPVREYVVPRDSQDALKLAGLFAPMHRGVCFIGHSHVPAVYYEDGRIFVPKVNPATREDGVEGPYSLGVPGTGSVANDEQVPRAIVNVGSVGQPRDGDPRLSYVLYDGENITFVRLNYDIEAAASRILDVPDLPDYLAERLPKGR